MMLALLVSAAIVSDAAKMFFTGGEWLPDVVPNAAVYDSADPTGKELRLTTNVAAAVVSMYSGILERGVVGCANGVSWMNELGPDKLGMETFRTNWLTVTDTSYDGNYIWMDNPAVRTNGSYRVLRYSDISRLRDVLVNVADGWWRDESDYGVDTWNGSWWGSSKFGGDEFPSWSWSTNAPWEVVSDGDWRKVWPQYTSCTDDSIWRTSPHAMHGALEQALNFWDIGAIDDYASRVNDICTNASPYGCFQILMNRLGDSAAQFTNNTYRLSYYRLGSLETAVASMDTTYSTDEPTHNNWNVDRRVYVHQKGQSCQVSTASVATDLDKMTASLSCDWDLEDFDTWSTVTNESRQAENPEYVCMGDTASGLVTIKGSCPIFVTFDAVSNALDEVYVDEEHSGGLFSTSISPGGVEMSGNGKTTTCTVSNGEWTVTASASASRSVSVEYTTDLTNTLAESVSYPVPWAWAHGMVKDRLNALEWRCSNTNFTVETDSVGQWYSFDEPEAAQYRSAYVGEYSTTNTFLSGWRNARNAHRDAVGAYSIANVGCSLKDRETLIPIGSDAVGHVVGSMPNQLTVNYGYKPIDTVIAAFWGNSSHNMMVFYNELTYEHKIITPGGVYKLGYLTFTYDRSVPVDSYFTLHPDRYTTGDIAPAQRIRWKFNNLHEED